MCLRENLRRRWGVRADEHVLVRPAPGSRTQLSSLPATMGRFPQPVERPEKSESRSWKARRVPRRACRARREPRHRRHRRT
eukprot:309856-Pleurochrysis_carterae.AAC.1